MLALLLLAACFDVDRRSRQSDTLPETLLGAWRGTWTSTGSTGAGSVAMAVREFEGNPILQLDTQHPCLIGSRFEFVQTGALWQLLLDDQPVFEATLDPTTRRLDGVYDCDADSGTWGVSWDRELPEIVDLSGAWTGTWVSVQPPLQGTFAMDLVQQYSNGRLLLTASIRLPGAGDSIEFDAGEVVWRESTFDLVLESGNGSGPLALLQGRGDPQTLAIEDGLFLVENAQVPFRLALWSATPVGR